VLVADVNRAGAWHNVLDAHHIASVVALDALWESDSPNPAHWALVLGMIERVDAARERMGFYWRRFYEDASGLG
jgi:hypothetical protein